MLDAVFATCKGTSCPTSILTYILDGSAGSMSPPNVPRTYKRPIIIIIFINIIIILPPIFAFLRAASLFF